MQLATIQLQGVEVAAVHLPDRGLCPVPALGDDLPSDLLAIIEAGLHGELRERLERGAAEVAPEQLLSLDEVTFGPLFRTPQKIWGIGLNYRAHAEDLRQVHPDEPASFIKANHTIIGPGDEIVLPDTSHHVTSEAELGLVFGERCEGVEEEEALRSLVGVCPILDQTAVDILERNPRFLTRSKNFPTFFSFGPVLVTLDEVLGHDGTLDHLQVGTYSNGEVYREDVVKNMAHGPEHLISLHSKMMPFFPGDVISSGSPGGVRVEAGDVAECRIPGVGTLRNPVVRR
jgi:2-keto-4-pentenoate hydratase/2-oxohepta-3-ene-1,7-dioic acid hydratase in catechol pathway